MKKVIYLISFGGILIFQYHSFSPISLLETNFVACNTRRCSSLHKPTSAYEYLPRHFSPLMPLFLNRLKCACMCYQLSLTLVVVVSQSIIVLNTTQRNNWFGFFQILLEWKSLSFLKMCAFRNKMHLKLNK